MKFIESLSDRVLSRILREETASAFIKKGPCFAGYRVVMTCSMDGQGTSCWNKRLVPCGKKVGSGRKHR
jgi:hypothetical protein